MTMKRIVLLTIFCIFFAVKSFAVIHNGNCGASGDNLTWRLDTETGVLSITGIGEMQGFMSNNEVPWLSYRFQIMHVYIDDGVTSITRYAFHECNRLLSVSLGENIRSIGVLAFYNCSALTDIFIPEKVTSIGNNAFRGCGNLTSINISNEITSIGHSAFRGCRALKIVSLPEKLESIGDEAFRDCNSLTSITIPPNVKSIGDRAFLYCRNIKIIKSLSLKAPTVGIEVFTGLSGIRIMHLPYEASGYYANGWEKLFRPSEIDTFKIVLSVEIFGNGKLDNSFDGKYYFVPGETLTFTPGKGSELKSVTFDNNTLDISDNQFIPLLSIADSGKTLTASFSNKPIVRFVSENIIVKEVFVNAGAIIPTVEVPTLTRSGYLFVSWNTRTDGKGKTWDFATDTVTEIMNLYAQWMAYNNPEQARIVTDPISTNLCYGSRHTLSVYATGDNLQYQWYLNNKPISNATSNTYIINTANELDFGTYTVVVKAAKGDAVTSRPATINLANPLSNDLTLSTVPNEILTINKDYQFATKSLSDVGLYEWSSKSGTAVFWPKTGMSTRVYFTQTGEDVIYLTLTHPCGKYVISHPITVYSTVDNEPINDNLKAYPNPVTDIMTLTGLRYGAPIKIYTQTGVAIATYKAEGDRTTIDLTDLKPGLYFLATDGQTIKFIKK